MMRGSQCVVVAAMAVLSAVHGARAALPPHPAVDPAACNLNEELQTRYGTGLRLCDADKLFTAEDMGVVAHHVAAVRLGADGLREAAAQRAAGSGETCGGGGEGECDVTADATDASPTTACHGVELGVLVQDRHDDDAGTPEAHCRAVFNAWGLGRKQCGNGVLLYLAVGSRKIHICTGAGAREAPNGLADEVVAGLIDAAKPMLKDDKHVDAVAFIAAGVLQEVAQNVKRSWEQPSWWDTRVLGGRVADLFVFGVVGAVILAFIFFSVTSEERRRRELRTCEDKLTKIERAYAVARARDMGMFDGSCPICLDDFPPAETRGGAGDASAAPSPREDGADDYAGGSADTPAGVRVLRCGHVFHDECIAEWLERTKGDARRVCPVCRMDIDTGKEAEVERAGVAPPSDEAGAAHNTHDEASSSVAADGDREDGGNGVSEYAKLAIGAAQGLGLLLSDELEFRLRRVREQHPEVVSSGVWARWERRLAALDSAAPGDTCIAHDLMADVAFVAEEYRAQQDAAAADTNTSWGGGDCDGGGGAGGDW